MMMIDMTAQLIPMIWAMQALLATSVAALGGSSVARLLKRVAARAPKSSLGIGSAVSAARTA